MVRLHEFAPSGNCYKVRLVLSQLGIPFERVPVDLRAGEAKTPSFRARFPLGRVPVVELDSGAVLAESNAIIWHFAEGSPLVPTDPVQRAEVLQWLFWEQYSHEPFVAVVRAWVAFFGVPPGKEAELAERRARAEDALATMERHLGGRTFFVGDRYSLADVALYAYTHVAPEGGLDLGGLPNVRAWMARVSAEPRHVPITG